MKINFIFLSMHFYFHIGLPMISGNTTKMFRIWWQREIGTKANTFENKCRCVQLVKLIRRTVILCTKMGFSFTLTVKME